jgi:hypothetical protein
VGNATWWLEYELATGIVVLNDKYKPEVTGNPNWASVSPDKKYVVYSRNFNLFMMDAENFEKAKKNAADSSIVETQLTTDGERNYAFGRGGGAGNQDQQQDNQNDQEQGQGTGRGNATQSEADKKYGGPRVSAGGVSWSQDNKKFSIMRTDNRKVADLWVINALSNPRPTLNTYKYAMPGEENQPQAELHVVDLAGKKALKMITAEFKDQQMALNTAPTTNLQREKGETVSRWLLPGSDKIVLNRTSRDLKRIDIVSADTTTGEPKTLVAERSNTYIELQPLRVIAGGKEMIQWSERDGWGHYYLYDASGKMVRQITSGEYVTTGITGVDETKRLLYFTAAGKETSEDPYYIHFYSANIDTGAVKLLDPGNASHTVAMNDKADVLRRQLVAHRFARRGDPLRHARQQAHGARKTGRVGTARGGFPVPGGVHGQGRRRHHRPLRDHVQAVRLRSGQEVSHHRVCLSWSADRVSDQDVQSAQRECRAGQRRVHRDRSRQSRRQPDAIEVVPQLRVRQSARLRRAGQEGRHRTAREAIRLDRSRSRGHVGPFGRRLHDRRGDVRVSGLLQGRHL